MRSGKKSQTGAHEYVWPEYAHLGAACGRAECEKEKPLTFWHHTYSTCWDPFTNVMYWHCSTPGYQDAWDVQVWIFFLEYIHRWFLERICSGVFPHFSYKTSSELISFMMVLEECPEWDINLILIFLLYKWKFWPDGGKWVTALGDMQTGGSGNRTTDFLISGWPSLPPEPQQSLNTRTITKSWGFIISVYITLAYMVYFTEYIFA